MSDRLTELQRQRALAAEQLAWFDHEIAKETGLAPSPAVTSAAPVAIPVALPRVPVTPAPDLSDAAARAAEDILARYQQPAATTTTDIKKGCYAYFTIFMVAIVLFVIGAYFLYVRTR